MKSSFLINGALASLPFLFLRAVEPLILDRFEPPEENDFDPGLFGSPGLYTYALLILEFIGTITGLYLMESLGLIP